MGLPIGRMTTLVSSFEEEMALENKNHAWPRQERGNFRRGMASLPLCAAS